MNDAARMAQVPLGMAADKVLKRWKKPLRVKDLGEDKDKRGEFVGEKGHVVGWEYPWGFLTFKRRRYGGAHCYRVMEKCVREEHHGQNPLG